MWLINVQTLKLEEFIDERQVPYMILSHRWDQEEVSFKQFQEDPRPDRVIKLKGYTRITKFCHLVAEAGRKYGWVDTCCIDKSSSAELQEAINSMYKWYGAAVCCFAYLSDVTVTSVLLVSDVNARKTFTNSRWFTQGWTLQELLAPDEVNFYNTEWMKIGTAGNLSELVHEAAGISRRQIGRFSPNDVLCIAEIMSRAGRRKTIRVEDQAYCLLGLFNINMPMLYGEGKRAFIRLQHEILLNGGDQLIFLWSTAGRGHGYDRQGGCSLLAESPADFVYGQQAKRYLMPSLFTTRSDTRRGSQGITVELAIKHIDGRTIRGFTHAIVASTSAPEDGRFLDRSGHAVGILLRKYGPENRWRRIHIPATKDCHVQDLVVSEDEHLDGYHLSQIMVVDNLAPIEYCGSSQRECNSFNIRATLLPNGVHVNWCKRSRPRTAPDKHHCSDMSNMGFSCGPTNFGGFRDSRGNAINDNETTHNFVEPSCCALLIDFGLAGQLVDGTMRLYKLALGFDRAFVPIVFVQLQTRAHEGGVQHEELDDKLFNTTHESDPLYFSPWAKRSLPLGDLHISINGCSLKVCSETLWSCRMDAARQFNGRGMSFQMTKRPGSAYQHSWLFFQLERQYSADPWDLTVAASGKSCQRVIRT